MSNRGYALSRFSGDKVAYCTKCFLGLFTKSTSIFDYKWDEIAVIELLVRVLDLAFFRVSLSLVVWLGCFAALAQ